MSGKKRSLFNEIKAGLEEVLTYAQDQKKLKEKAKRIYKTYGITLDEWNELAKDGCHICGTKEGRLCVDHIHTKGFKSMAPEQRKKWVRGILCFLCNTGLKGFEKTSDGARNRKQLEGTVRYFQQFKLKGELK